jgi:3D (Asp-Asp-Asp) domain-containing protein
MCLAFQLTFMTPNTLTPFQHAAQVIDRRVDNKEMVFKTNELGLIEYPMIEKLEKDKIGFENNREGDKNQQDKQKKNGHQWKEFTLTFYSRLVRENSSSGAVTCTGKPLVGYMIANNVYNLGTQIYLEGYGTKIVEDRGASKYFNTTDRLDVFVPREYGESNSHYFKRVEKMGVKKVKGYIIN